MKRCAIPINRSHFSQPADDCRRGTTLLEILVAVCIMGLLVALVTPAVQKAREASRRVSCVNHLRQIGLALQGHESVHGSLPPVGLFTVELLPYLNEPDLYRRYQEQAARRDYEFGSLFGPVKPMMFTCPSDSSHLYGSNYCANYGSGYQTWGLNGLFGYHDRRKFADVRDGLSQTAAISEILRSDGSRHRLRAIWDIPPRYQKPSELDRFADFCEQLPPDPTALSYPGFTHSRGRPWYLHTVELGYNHISPPNRPNCQNSLLVAGSFPAGSFHGGGANTLYADGHVRFTSEDVDRNVWRDHGSRHQGRKEAFE